MRTTPSLIRRGKGESGTIWFGHVGLVQGEMKMLSLEKGGGGVEVSEIACGWQELER